MVSIIGSGGIAGWLSGAKDALGRLGGSAPSGSQPKSQAAQTLETVLNDLKAAPRKLAVDAARQKISNAQIRIAGLKLAAGSAAALGNARATYFLAKDIRDIARDLHGSLDAVGQSSTGTLPADRQAELDTAAAGLKSDAADLLKGLSDVLRRGRPALLFPLFSSAKDRGQAADMYRQAESALDGARNAAQSTVAVTLKI